MLAVNLCTFFIVSTFNNIISTKIKSGSVLSQIYRGEGEVLPNNVPFPLASLLVCAHIKRSSTVYIACRFITLLYREN